MAPKGMKRAAVASKEDPEAKRVAAFLKQNGVTKPTHEAIREIVQHPMAGLPSDCRDMLLAMLPWSLSIPSGQRGEAHNVVVKMVEEVAAGIQASMREGIQAESANEGDLDQKKAELRAGIQSAEAMLAEAKAAVEERKRVLADASATLLRQKRSLSELESKAKKDFAELEKAQAQKQEVETALIDSFQKLKSGEWQHGEEDALFQPVQALMDKLDLDESLVTSLPVSLKKRERGAFDQVVVHQFEQSLRSKIREMAAAIEVLETSMDANAASMEAATTALQIAQATQQEVAGKFGVGQEAVTTASATVKEAEQRMLAFEPEFEKATTARNAKAEELESFEAHHLCILKMMVQKVSKKREAELAQEVASKEQKPDIVQAAAVIEKGEEVAAAQTSTDAVQASTAEAHV